MLSQKISELRKKLNESVTKEKDYEKTYRLSVELDELIAEYYRLKLNKEIDKKEEKE